MIMKTFSESLIKSYDSNILINKLKNKYKDKINDIYIQKSKSNIESFSIQFDKKYMEDIAYDESLYKLLDFFGYYITEYKEIKSENNQILRFEPIFGEKCNDLVYNKCNGIIYHVTSEKYISKIRKKGLVPFEGQTYRNFTSRIFFSCAETNEETINNIKDIINQISDIKSYIILRIDLRKYKYNVDFYYDPSEDDQHNYIYANAYFYPHMIDEIGKLDKLEEKLNESYKEVMLGNKKIKLKLI